MGERTDRAMARLRRQFAALRAKLPAGRDALHWLEGDRARLVRVPVAILMILGGLLSFLPVLGIWMLPFGIMLLAVDLPALRGPVSALMIRARVRLRRWQRRRRRS